MVGAAFVEVELFPVQHLRGLPIPTSLVVRSTTCANMPTAPIVVLTTSKRRFGARFVAGEVVFVPSEYELLARLAEHGGLFAEDFGRWVQKKKAEPTWSLTEKSARPVGEPKVAHPITFGELFQQLGVELVEVVLEREAAPEVIARKTEEKRP